MFKVAKNRILKTEQQSRSAGHKLDEIININVKVEAFNEDIASKFEKMERETTKALDTLLQQSNSQKADLKLLNANVQRMFETQNSYVTFDEYDK